MALRRYMVLLFVAVAAYMMAGDTLLADKVLLSDVDSPYVWVENAMNEAFLAYDIQDDFRQFDQMTRQTLQSAENTYDTDLILRAHLLYLRLSPENNFSNQLIRSIDRVEALVTRQYDRDLAFDAYVAISKAATKSMIVMPQLGETALKNVLKAKSEGTIYENKETDIELGLLLGEILLNQDKTEEAYQELLTTKTLIQQLDDIDSKSTWEYALNEELFKFFKSIKDWDEAGKYKHKQLEWLKKKDSDSLKLMWQHYELVSMSKISGRKIDDPEHLKTILNFAKRHNNERLKQWTLALYREHLIQEGEYEALKQLYEKEYPEELAGLMLSQPILHCMIMGFLCEQEEKTDSAQTYYDRAEQLLTKDTRKHFASVQYRRLGMIHERHGNLEKAKEYLEKAYALADEVSYEQFALEALTQLEALLVKMGRYKEAYEYSMEKIKLEESILNWEKQRAIMRMSFSNELVLEQINEQKDYEEKKRLHARQNWLIAIILALAVIAMMMLTTAPVAEWVIEMMAFFTILSLFEFIILTIDHELHYMTGGAPLPMFGAKVFLLSILFPLHHVIEKGVIKFMKNRHRLKNPEDTATFTFKKSLRKGLAAIWPWTAPVNKDQ